MRMILRSLLLLLLTPWTNIRRLRDAVDFEDDNYDFDDNVDDLEVYDGDCEDPADDCEDAKDGFVTY